jgi:hypothetical protein
LTLWPKIICSPPIKRIWMWWHIPVIPALGKPREEDHKFKASLGSIMTCKKNNFKKVRGILVFRAVH